MPNELNGKNVYVIRARMRFQDQLKDVEFGLPPRKLDEILNGLGATVLNSAYESSARFSDITQRRNHFNHADAIVFSPQNFSLHSSSIRSGTSWQETDLGREDAWLTVYSKKPISIYEAKIVQSNQLNPQLQFQLVERAIVESLLRNIEEHKRRQEITGEFIGPVGLVMGERGFDDYRQEMGAVNMVRPPRVRVEGDPDAQRTFAKAPGMKNISGTVLGR